MIYLNENDIFLFQGDSITHGGRVFSERDMNHVMGHGYQASAAGRMAVENLARRPVILNRGVSGDTSEKLLARLQQDVLKLKPTAMSLLIGINDCLSLSDSAPAQYEHNMNRILGETAAALPGIRLILMEPFAFDAPFYPDEEEKRRVKKRIALCSDCAGAAKRLAQKHGALFIPLKEELAGYVESCPPGHIIWDGAHPTFAGHELIYRIWYREVEKSGLFAKEEA